MKNYKELKQIIGLLPSHTTQWEKTRTEEAEIFARYSEDVRETNDFQLIKRLRNRQVNGDPTTGPTPTFPTCNFSHTYFADK